MSALSHSPCRSLAPPRAGMDRGSARPVPLALIAVAHALVFYGFYSGIVHRVVEAALPREVVVSLVAAPPPPPVPPPSLLPVQTVPPPAIDVPPVVVSVAAPERAISLPPPAPAPAARAEKAAPVQVAAAAPAAPAPPATPRTISSGVEYLQPPQPEYPALSKRMGEQGKVVLRILVNEKGIPDQVQVQRSSGFARLDEAGRQAALRALFKPHIEDGRPVAVFVIVPLNFTLAS